MLSKIKSCGLLGIDSYIAEVEADITNGMPGLEIVGYIVMKTKVEKTHSLLS